jgi:hypothetical protein
MILSNLEEVCVFASASNFAPLPAGLVCHTVEMPRDFKDASTGKPFQNNVAAFEVVVEGAVVGNWNGQFPGVVRPKVQREKEVVESRDSTVSASNDR